MPPSAESRPRYRQRHRDQVPQPSRSDQPASRSGHSPSRQRRARHRRRRSAYQRAVSISLQSLLRSRRRGRQRQQRQPKSAQAGQLAATLSSTHSTARDCHAAMVSTVAEPPSPAGQMVEVRKVRLSLRPTISPSACVARINRALEGVAVDHRGASEITITSSKRATRGITFLASVVAGATICS